MTPSLAMDDVARTRIIGVLALAVLVLVPLQIIGAGYLPPDDALRHAAKAVSGREWLDILVLRPGTMDSSPGWHAVLTAVHRAFGADARALVVLEVVILFLLVTVPPLFVLRRPEPWMVALAAVAVLEPLLVERLLVGRPLLLSMSVVVVLCLTWERLDSERVSRGAFAAVAAMIAAATWIHGAWYLFALPLAAFLLARPRAGLRFGAAAGLGVLVGALLTGSPIDFLWQHVQHVLLAFRGTQTSELVGEFRAYPGAPVLVVFVLIVIASRRFAEGAASPRSLLRDPVFFLAVLGWVLGFRVARFWLDWGLPAVLVFVARRLEGVWPATLPRRHQMVLAAAALGACFLAMTADVERRWSGSTRNDPYAVLTAPEHRAALPDPGGILYAHDMKPFYDLFFTYPDAPWRYSTGYEPGLMPAEDLEVYRAAHGSRDVMALLPWARKLRPEDRLVVRNERTPPPLSGLAWYHAGNGVWIGRTPR